MTLLNAFVRLLVFERAVEEPRRVDAGNCTVVPVQPDSALIVLASSRL